MGWESEGSTMMKKLLFVLLIMLLFVPVYSQEQGNSSFIAFATGQTNDQFDNYYLGGKYGYQFKIDSKRDIWIRTIYSQVDVVGKNIETIQIGALIRLYTGKKWHIWYTIGGDNYVDGEMSGTDLFTGAGLSRKIFTISESGTTINMFSEFSFTDASIDNNIYQVNIGFILNRAK